MDFDNFILLWITFIYVTTTWTYINGVCTTDPAKTVEHNETCFYIVTTSEFSSYYWIDTEKYCQQNYNGHMALADRDLLLKVRAISLDNFWLAPHNM
ncbi:unnamed protein product [Cyprideis torosa]|uniref:Uncharacterized protein n=1 Tax=Cyprideis torosa TaxID=163714 RepID=A0A7R8WP71_9CRUS|nr:unnamed protein product [Cyprideis torosa]CAG0901476.1 unnamed protein product [Cyprideis torosa]